MKKRNNIHRNARQAGVAILSKPLFIALALVIINLNSFSQNSCKIQLSAEHNRTVRTITDSEYVYALFVINSGTSDRDISLSAGNYNEECTNPDGLPVDSNINLNISLLDSDLQPISNNVRLGPGGSYKFFLKVEVPDGSPFDAWNCTQVIASSQGCRPATLLLHTFYPNPENLE